jgi:hypothetical protein
MLLLSKTLLLCQFFLCVSRKVAKLEKKKNCGLITLAFLREKQILFAALCCVMKLLDELNENLHFKIRLP